MPFTSDYYENKIIDHLFRNQAFTPPTTVYVSLHSGRPGDTGANEISGGGYARQAVTLTAASGGASENSAAVSFSNMPAVTVVAFGLWDASTAGNLLAWGWLQPSGGYQKLFVVRSADLASDDITSPSHGLAANDRVVFESLLEQSLPTGLSMGTVYFVTGTPATDTFRVSTTQGGSAVDITAVGSGLLLKVTPKTTNAGDTFQFPTGDLDLIFE
jgi:hypothetical protein